jgi:hypothetical protein
VKIPYVIDNVTHHLADVIHAILHDQPGQQVDVATAYFSIRGFEQSPPISTPRRMQPLLARSDLHLVCYEFVV